MARITVEDCIAVVPNRFELAILAARRARDISSGASPRVERDDDKNTIVALREIAGRVVTPDDLRRRVMEQISSPQPPPNEVENDEADDLPDLNLPDPDEQDSANDSALADE